MNTDGNRTILSLVVLDQFGVIYYNIGSCYILTSWCGRWQAFSNTQVKYQLLHGQVCARFSHRVDGLAKELSD